MATLADRVYDNGLTVLDTEANLHTRQHNKHYDFSTY